MTAAGVAVDAGDVSRTELLEARRTAIRTSGWGARFHFVQPRNACFWVYLLLVAVGAWTLVGLIVPTAGIFRQANTAALASASLFAVVFLLFLHRFDRWERTPGRLAVAAFVGGGIAAPWAIAVPGNAALMGLYAKVFGQAWADDWQAGLTAPFVEELGKGAIFVLLLGLAPRVVRTVYDGLIVGAYVGLGFQVLEDMLYGQNAAYQHFGDDQVGSVLHTFVIRALTGVASHAMYTAIFSAGVIYLLGTPAQPRRVGRGILLVLAAMVLHGTWDSMGALSQGGFVIYLLMPGITVASIVILFGAIRWASTRERGYLAAILAPEILDGTVTPEEATALTGPHRQHRQTLRAAAAAEPHPLSKRQERHVLLAVRDLAHDLAEADGDESPNVTHARSEVARVRQHL